MKKLLTLLITCLIGTIGAWAAEVSITETYDFAAFITANGTANLTTSGDGIAQEGTSEKVGTVKVVDNFTANSQTLDLKGRFAVDYQYNAGSKIRFMWRSSGNNYQHGLAGQWNNNGTNDAQGAARFSILNLKAGDKVTLTYYKKSGIAADPYTCKAGSATYGENSTVAVDEALNSGTEYTITNDGNFDLYFTNNNFAIASIVIKTTGNETVTAPVFTKKSAFNNSRTITIAAGASDAGSNVTTYYTTDGTTPTTASPSFTETSKDITIGSDATSETTVTVKALSISSLSVVSAVTSDDYTVGTTIKLAKPSIEFKDFAQKNGCYYKQYSITADKTGLFGESEITVNATINNEEINSPYTANIAGTIQVFASAEGYADSDTETLTVDGQPYGITQQFDFTKDEYREGLSVEGNNITITGAGVQVYRITDVNHIEGITLSNTNFGITKAQNSDTRKGIAPRWGKGSITLNEWTEGSIATLRDHVNNSIYSTSTNGTFSFGSQINYNTFTELTVYTPGEAITVNNNPYGLSTFVTTYALDFSEVDGLTAYIATAEDDDVIKLTPVTEVPANTPIIVKGALNAKKTYSVPVGTCETLSAGQNLLSGDASNPHTVGANENIYALKASDGMMHPVTSNVEIPAKKAYLVSSFERSNSLGAKSFTFGNIEDDANIITTTSADGKKAATRFFNAAGQQVGAGYKGMVIDENGNKYIK